MTSEHSKEATARPSGAPRSGARPIRVVRVGVAVAVLAMGLGAMFALYFRPPAVTAPPPTASRTYLESLPIQTVGGKVDFGDVKPCGTDFTRTAKIRNQSAEPLEILAYSPNCACLSAKFIGDRTLEPGAEREVELTIHPSGHGHRSTVVEFACKSGFAGSLRVDFAFTRGVIASPSAVDIHEGTNDFAIDVEVFPGDGRSVSVVALDPPIGSFEVMPAAMAKVSLSSYEAIQFVESPAGRVHPGVTLGANGKPQELVVTITTDHPECPLATFTFNFVN